MTKQEGRPALDVLKNPGLLDSEVADEHRYSLEVPAHLTSYWVEEIHRLWAQGATSTLALARVVCRARTTLAYGEWTRLWPGLMPFSKRKAEMLGAIGRGIGEIDAQIFAHLPRAWSTLYYLSKLGQAVVEQLVRAGTIHPGLTLDEARALAAKHKGQKPSDQRKTPRQKLREFERFVVANLSEWTVEERQWTQSRLVILADLLGRERPGRVQAEPSNRPASVDASDFATLMQSLGNACPHSLVPPQNSASHL
jgi:hypothetical protein